MSCKTNRISYRTYLKTAETYSVYASPSARYYYNSNSRYPNNPRLYRESEKSSKSFGEFAERGILIHLGNYDYDGVGCLLPGASTSIKNGDHAVWNSGNTVNSIMNLCKSRGWHNMRLNIINAF